LNGVLHGVDSKIEPPYLLPLQKRWATHAEVIVQYLRGQTDVVLLVDLPGNVGDLFIHEATKHLLVKFGVGFREASVSDVLSRIDDASTLLVPGSGAWTANWHNWLPELCLQAANRAGKVIVLPSEFDARIPVVHDALSAANLYPMARDMESYLQIRPFMRSVLSCDLSVHHPELSRIQQVPTVQETACMLRTDRSSRFSSLVPSLPMNNDVSSTCTDVETWLTAIASSTTVITDRLHVAVATILLGRRLIAVESDEAKLRRYLSYTFRWTAPVIDTEESLRGVLSDLGYL
jgi:hypothetical protein